MTLSDGCKIAFLAVRFLNGSISYDTSTWEQIRGEAQRLKRSCGGFAPALSGGNVVVGEVLSHTNKSYGLPLFAQVIILGLP